MRTGNYTLDKKDLITLVTGHSPSFEVMVKKPFSYCGEYNGSYGNWTWNDNLYKLSMDQLWDMHLIMKDQYK